MMRLTRTSQTPLEISFRLEGALSGSSARLLESELQPLFDKGMRVRLDCSQVTYIDREGALVLRRLRRRLEIVRCRPLVLEMLDGVRQ